MSDKYPSQTDSFEAADPWTGHAKTCRLRFAGPLGGGSCDCAGEAGMTPGEWRAGNNGAGKRKWFVWRPKDAEHVGGRTDYHEDARGFLIRYASHAGAKRVADGLNRGPAATTVKIDTGKALDMLVATKSQAIVATPYTITPARYAKGKMVVQPRDNRGDYKGRAASLCEALGGKWVGRSHGYHLSPTAAARFEKLYAAGFDAHLRIFRDSPVRLCRGDWEGTLREALALCEEQAA